MIMSLVQMGSGGRQVGDAVGGNNLVLRVGILFIVKNVRGDSIMMGRRLVRESIGYAGANMSMITGDVVSHRECNI